jgi:PAS domain S-box-containing protein
MHTDADNIFNEPAAGIDTAKLRALVNHIPGAIYRCRGDEALSLEFFSDEIEKLTGYPLDYFMKNKEYGYSNIVHIDDVNRLRNTIRQAVAEKEKFEIEYRIIKKDGEVRWVYESGQGIYDDGDKVSYVDGCIFDITRRKNTEAALAKSKDEIKRLALVAHNTTNSVMITDAEENITWVNEGYTRISGYSLEEVRGKKIGYSLEGRIWMKTTSFASGAHWIINFLLKKSFSATQKTAIVYGWKWIAIRYRMKREDTWVLWRLKQISPSERIH